MSVSQACNSLYNDLTSVNSKLSNIQCGKMLTTNINGYFRTARITFQKSFSSTPYVVASLSYTSAYSQIETRLVIDVYNITTTGCTIQVGDNAGDLANKDIYVSYIAIAL